MLHTLQLLLDKAAVIKLRQEALEPENVFNIFQVLRSGHEEVSLHSRFLYELLNPKGSHGMGDIFLRHFAKVCSFPDLSYDTVQVLREHANIDILIRDHSYAIVIENKIYAGDQHEQLQRYYKYVKDLHFKPIIFYLTLDGHEPSEQSTGNLLDKPVLISYATEITQWLTNCVKEAATKPALRETIIQYQNLINQLTGNTMSEAEKQQVLGLMAQGDNAESAAIIARNWNHVRWHTEFDFWTELLSFVENSYEVSDSGRFSDSALDKVIHGRRGKNPWYGLSFCIGSLHDIPLNVRIERNEGPMYYGITYGETNDIIRARMRNAIQSLISQNTTSWAGLKTTNSGINFESFSNSITLQLANPEKRKKIVLELWQELQEFIREIVARFKNEFDSDFTPAIQKAHVV